MVSSLTEDILLVLFFFFAWHILLIIKNYIFGRLFIENNKAFQFLFYIGALVIISIIVKEMQNERERCEKEEANKT